MSAQRFVELERLLRKLRQRAFDSGKAASLIPVVKARLAPEWCKHVELIAHKRGQRLLYLYA